MELGAAIGLPRDGYEVEISRRKGDETSDGEVLLKKLGFPIAKVWYPIDRGPRLVVLGCDNKTVEEVRDLAVALNFFANMIRLWPRLCPDLLRVAIPTDRDDGKADLYEVRMG